MEDLYQQSETASLPERLPLKHKARAEEPWQRPPSPSLPYVQSGGTVLWKDTLWFLVRHRFLTCFHTSSLATLNYFDLQKHKQNKPTATQPPEPRHWISHASGMVPVKVPPYPGALSRSGPSATPRTTLFLELKYHHTYVLTLNLLRPARERRGTSCRPGNGKLGVI